MNCPSCGAPIQFKTASAVFQVCAYCQAMLVKKGVHLEQIGKVAPLLRDPTVIQLGTIGRYKGRGFAVVGRARWDWDHGFWNEWWCRYEDGRTAWLAEAQGEYLFFFKELTKFQTTLTTRPGIGRRGVIDGVHYEIADQKVSKVGLAEGELPYIGRPGESRTSIDLIGKNQLRGTIELREPAGSGPVFFAGEQVTYADLKLQLTRRVDGWNP
jgi:hypothetical protein